VYESDYKHGFMHNTLITVKNIKVLLEIEQSTKHSENVVGTNGR